MYGKVYNILYTFQASFVSCIHYDDLFDRIQVYLRLQKIAKQNPKYYSKLSSGPFAWKAINDSWGQKVKPSSKFFPNPDDELAKKELRAQETFFNFTLVFLD